MKTYIALLRGINVGGKKKILMSELKQIFSNLKFENTLTYIQSGNVIFQTSINANTSNISQAIENKIASQFGFDVPVIVISKNELLKSINVNSYITNNNIELDKMHLTFLKEKPNIHNVKSIDAKKYLPDKFEIIDCYIFIYCEGKYHKTKLSNTFFEKRLKTNCTTRNWKTVIKLLELANNQSST